jgi:MFS family permease
MKGFRWLVMFMIFLACTINFLDRSALAYVIEPLEKTYGFTNTQFGLLSSAFGLSYIFMTIIGGILVDQYGSRKILTYFCLLWSITSALMGFVSGFTQLLLLRLILGIAEGPAFPALTRVSSDWLPANERAKALAFSLAAIPFSSVIGAPFITQLIIHFGWKAMFVILGSLGVIWSIIWYIIFSDDPKNSSYASTDEIKYIKTHLEHKKIKFNKNSFFELVKNKNLIFSYLSYFCLGYLLSFSISWLPGFFQQSFHLNLKDIGWYLCIPWTLSTLFILIGGSLSDFIWMKTKNIRYARTYIISFAQFISALFFIPILYLNSFIPVLICISLGLSFGLFPIAAFYSLNSDLAHQQAGTSQGIMSACLGIASFLAPALTGYFSNLDGNFNTAILLIIILSLSSSIILFSFHMRPIRFGNIFRGIKLRNI